MTTNRKSGILHHIGQLFGSEDTSVETSFVSKIPKETVSTPISEPVKIIKHSAISLKMIHDEFYNEVDKNLEDARLVVSTSGILSEEEIYSAGVLSKYGFNNEQVKAVYEKHQKIAQIQLENLKRKALADLILKCKQEYPLYKFISQESVVKLCKRYGLSYGNVLYFNGNVPMKNIKQLEAFKISNKIKARLGNYNHRNTIVDGYLGEYDRNEHLEYAPLMICAPFEMFQKNRQDQIQKNPTIESLSKVLKDDPIVLQPVAIKYDVPSHNCTYNDCYQTFGYLIVTAWGDEASDENVVNEKFN